MRIAIVAPGAVGGYFGVLLARSGENVGALARGAHLDAVDVVRARLADLEKKQTPSASDAIWPARPRSSAG